MRKCHTDCRRPTRAVDRRRAAQHQRLQPRDQRVAGEAPAREREVGRGRAVELAEPAHAVRRRAARAGRRARRSAASSSRPARRARSASKRSGLIMSASWSMRIAGTIATPEGVQLALPLAGIGTRFMSHADRPRRSGCSVALVVIVVAADRSAAARRGDRRRAASPARRSRRLQRRVRGRWAAGARSASARRACAW